MSAQYSVKHFFQKVDISLLKVYFESRNELVALEWDDLTICNPERIYEAWAQLSEKSRTESESWFRAVWGLAVKEGLRVIHEEADYHDVDLREPLSKYQGLLAKAFWVYLHHRKIFTTASKFFRADHLNARYWKLRSDLPAKEPDLSREARQRLSSELSKYYWETQERGKDCTVDLYKRPGMIHSFFCYPADYADTMLVYDDQGRLESQYQKGAFHVIFQYNQGTGALDVYVQGGKQVRCAVEEIFSRVILGIPLPELPRKEPYRLKHFARRGFVFRNSAPHLIRGVRVRSIRLSVASRGVGRITIEADERRRKGNIYDLLEGYLDKEQTAAGAFAVTQVGLEVLLLRDDVEEPVRFNVTLPDSCNLPEGAEYQVIRDHFQAWGLYTGDSDELDLDES
ncbi:MAG TPA: hypothetical protein PKJ41_14485 [Bryobacteraceae bacterium]|mgnify:CR=1 FL=1|nr:hypothetical protein [Bryobacteraceae bacterium]HPT25151.1 hypothetical protein [Bryobacteraceae bacterium]